MANKRVVKLTSEQLQHIIKRELNEATGWNSRQKGIPWDADYVQESLRKLHLTMGNPVPSAALRAGMKVAAGYSSTNQGVDLVEVLGMTDNSEKYGEGGVKFQSVKEALVAAGVKSLKALEHKENQDSRGYGYGSYLVVRDLESGEEGPWYYLYSGRWARGSGAERLSFIELLPATEAMGENDELDQDDDQEQGMSLTFNENDEDDLDEQDDQLDQVSPKGWEGTTRAMKKHKNISNPWALARSMAKKGDKPHYSSKAPYGKKHESEDLDEAVVGADVADKITSQVMNHLDIEMIDPREKHKASEAAQDMVYDRITSMLMSLEDELEQQGIRINWHKKQLN